MNVLRITNGFDKLSDANLIIKTQNIVVSMTPPENPYFATPSPTLADMQDAIDSFTNAVAVAKTGSSYDKALKNQYRMDLIEMLHSLGAYVLFTAEGDFLIAQSSGFTIAKEPSPAPPITAAANQKLDDGANAGELYFSFDKVQGARSYIYQYTADPLTYTSTWETKVGTIRKVNFTGLDSGKKYWCRVMAIGINGQGVYSEPVSRVVQ